MVKREKIFLLLASLFILTACGVDSNRFRLEGRFRNMNQGEFWVYSIDGGIDGVDTVQVRNGRFSYETTLRMPSTFIMVFPNFSELPVFAQPGKTISIKGDVSHLKEIAVGGTDANDDMTKLRMQLNKLMPPDVPGAVEKFIKENGCEVYELSDEEIEVFKAAVADVTKEYAAQYGADACAAFGITV